MIKRFSILLMMMLGVQAVCGEEPDGGPSTNLVKIQDFTLSDQYKKERPQIFPKDKVSIFALADRKGSDELEDWITPFYKRYEDRVDICGVANMKGLPKLLRPMMRRIFKKSIEYPVMLDWKGSVCASWNYQAGVADIFVVNRTGHVAYRISGEANEKKLQACYAVIDRLNEEQRGEAAEKENGPPAGQDRPASESTSDAPKQES